MEPKSIQNRRKFHQKIEVGKRTAQNREKSRPGAPKGRKPRYDCLARLAISGRGGSLQTNKKIEDCIQVIPHADGPLARRIFILFSCFARPGRQSKMISKNTIPYIGTEILLLTKNDHNSTQNAPKSIIPEDFKSAGHFPSSDSDKSRFKALFKK